MARSRSVPTDLFEQPDFFELESDTQIILVGLVLGADDYGRGVAHHRLLARKLDKEERLIEQALTTLQARNWLCCYRVGSGYYYALTCWQEWQTLHKPTPSKYPAPPPSPSDPAPPRDPHPSGDSQGDSGIPQIPLEHPGTTGDIRPEEEEEEEHEHEKEERKRNEDEALPGTAVPALASPLRVGSDDGSLTQGTLLQKTHQVAQILQLPMSEALMRVIIDYGSDESLSLLGEADAAHEWIEDRHRNGKGQVMTPTFFRRWLGRERASMQAYQQLHLQEHTSRTSLSMARVARRRAAPAPSEDPYAAFVERRVRELAAEDSKREAQQKGVAVV
ncbi:MAG: hypothetical protein J2P37_11085 [Ktedonobacteraceae bacterium]|nr:hypothetical protein [Ktedonobacteraceae bacterium]